MTTKFPTIVVNEMMVTSLGSVADPEYVAQRGRSYGTPQGGVMCTGPYEPRRVALGPADHAQEKRRLLGRRSAQFNGHLPVPDRLDHAHQRAAER